MSLQHRDGGSVLFDRHALPVSVCVRVWGEGAEGWWMVGGGCACVEAGDAPCIVERGVQC